MIPSSITDWFAPSATTKDHIGTRKRAEVVLYASVIMAGPGPFFAVIFARQDMLFMSITCWVATFLMLLAPFVMRFTQSINMAVHVLSGAFVLVVLGGSINLDRSLSPLWPIWLIIPALTWMMSTGITRWIWTAVCIGSVSVFGILELIAPLDSLQVSKLTRSWLVCLITIACIMINILVVFVFDKKKDEARKEAEDARAALSASESRLLTVLRNAPIALWSFDQEGTNVLREGTAGQRFDSSVLPLFAPHVQKALAGQPVTSHLSWQDREYETEFVPVQSGESVVGVIGVATDVTERSRLQKIKELNEELREARDAAISGNRAKSMFLANMSHELRTPLNAIIGYSELLLEDAQSEGQDEMATDLARIHGSGQHLLSLISDILDLSKIEQDKIILHYSTCALPQLLGDLQNTLEPLAQKKGNRLAFHTSQAPETMEADSTRLRQILLNVLANACKFTDEGEVSLHVTSLLEGEQEWVEFVIRDTGIGIPPEEQEQIFEVFVQADQKGNKNYGGSGLGLALSQRLAHNMGGSIAVVSAEGEGATFTVRLPRCREELAAPSAA